VSFLIRDGDRELRVEVLGARADGTAKFRLWYYKWHETRPDKPYVDFKIRPYSYKDGRIRFKGFVYAKETEGIYEDHLREIAELLKREGVKGASLRSDGRVLEFSGAFRDSVLAKLGVRPGLPRGEPPAVQHLGGLRFKVGGQEVELKEGVVSGRYEFYAVLKFPSKEEAERFASSLNAIGVDARVVENVVRLDSDSFFGLLAATNATPPGLTLLYSSEEDDFRVYTSMEGGRMRFYFAVKHEGVRRAVEGLYDEGGKAVELWRKERGVLEAIRSAVAKAIAQLGHSAEVGEPTEKVDERGKVKGYYLYLYGHHFAAFLKHAADRVEAKPAEVRLVGRRIVISAGSVETGVEFKLSKGREAVFLTAQDVRETLALYKSLKALGVPVKITPEGVRVDDEAMWALVATVVERDTPSRVPAEVMPGVELLRAYSVSSMKTYIFRAEGLHYYFAVKTGEEWRAASGKKKRQTSAYHKQSRSHNRRGNKRHIPQNESRKEGEGEVRQKRHALHLPHQRRLRAVRPKAVVAAPCL